VKFVVLLRVSFYMLPENSELKQEVAYLSSRLERTMVSEKMIKDDLSRVEESATKATYKLAVGFERCEDKGKKSDPKFIPSSNYHKEEEALKPTKTHYPSNHKPSFNPKRGVKKKLQIQVRKFTFAYFMDMRVTWMSFAFGAREWRRGMWTMLKTHLIMSSLIFRLTFLLVLCHILLMDLTIAHMVLFHERVVLCLEALMLTHALIVVFVPHVGMVFLLEV
jgi:hypothetical protein